MTDDGRDDAVSATDGSDPATVTLEWDDGRTETVAVGDDTVLEAAEAAGIDLPFGCRTGACGTCTGRVVAGPDGGEGPGEGDRSAAVEPSDEEDPDSGGEGNPGSGVEGDPVEHVRPPRALKERHREAGYVLTCVARARADCRIRVGSDVAAELVENPWK